MEIYVVQPNDTIYSIASKYNVSVVKLIVDNQLDQPNNLVVGQTIVIVHPKQTYIAKEGDTLESISKNNNVSQMQLLRNNPFYYNRPIKAGEVITISYNTSSSMQTSGYIYPYVDRNIYKKTLPSLTYITIYNYRSMGDGEIISYYDDTEVIQLAKDYGTIPLFMATTLSAQGEPDLDAVYSLLSNDEYLEKSLNNSINIMKQKGYLGLNLVFNYLNPNSLDRYIHAVVKAEELLTQNNLLFFLTINPDTRFEDSELNFEKIKYNLIQEYVKHITFMQFVWGTNYGPPLPVNSIAQLKPFIDYVTKIVPSDKVLLGTSLISYDWSLPYVPGVSFANSLSIDSAIRLAAEVGAEIKFDEVSQSPYFNYKSNSAEHIVWTVDARSIEAWINLMNDNNLLGASIWNLMIYAAQLWLIVNSQFDIIKLIPSKFD